MHFRLFFQDGGVVSFWVQVSRVCILSYYHCFFYVRFCWCMLLLDGLSCSWSKPTSALQLFFLSPLAVPGMEWLIAGSCALGVQALRPVATCLIKGTSNKPGLRAGISVDELLPGLLVLRTYPEALNVSRQSKGRGINAAADRFMFKRKKQETPKAICCAKPSISTSIACFAFPSCKHSQALPLTSKALPPNQPSPNLQSSGKFNLTFPPGSLITIEQPKPTAGQNRTWHSSTPSSPRHQGCGNWDLDPLLGFKALRSKATPLCWMVSNTICHSLQRYTQVSFRLGDLRIWGGVDF